MKLFLNEQFFGVDKIATTPGASIKGSASSLEIPANLIPEIEKEIGEPLQVGRTFRASCIRDVIFREANSSLSEVKAV